MERNLRNRAEALLAALSIGVFEREEALGLALLSAAAGESIFLLGLPGVAKSSPSPSSRTPTPTNT